MMSLSNISTVSVIIPNYNHARYLRRRIDSVLAQTYRDFEVILLDECSTDESRSIVEGYGVDPNHKELQGSKLLRVYRRLRFRLKDALAWGLWKFRNLIDPHLS